MAQPALGESAVFSTGHPNRRRDANGATKEDRRKEAVGGGKKTNRRAAMRPVRTTTRITIAQPTESRRSYDRNWTVCGFQFFNRRCEISIGPAVLPRCLFVGNVDAEIPAQVRAKLHRWPLAHGSYFAGPWEQGGLR